MKTKSKSPPAAGPDADQLIAEDFPPRELPGLAALDRDGYRVVMGRAVMDDIVSHGKSSLEAEICGVLLGRVYRDDRGPWCFIEASVRGNYASGKQTEVTITSETWTHVNEVRDRMFPGKRFVGWYHTHPGFGIFLSGMDDFIQANFFAEPWQLALVYDPKSDERGIFVWRKGKTRNEPFVIVDDEAGAAVEAPASAGESTSALPSGTAGDLSGRLQTLEQRQKSIIAGLALVGLVAVVWPLAVSFCSPG